MPILLRLTYENGMQEDRMIPAEIWRRSHTQVSKMIVTNKGHKLESVEVDPGWETADVDIENNHYPRKIILSRIEAFKAEDRSKTDIEYRDLMHDSKTDIEEPKEKIQKK
jgi:hypothetical protein